MSTVYNIWMIIEKLDTETGEAEDLTDIPVKLGNRDTEEEAMKTTEAFEFAAGLEAEGDKL